MQLNSVTAATGTVPDSITFGYDDTTGNQITVWIKTPVVYEDEYIAPHASLYRTLFYLNFKAKGSFIDNPGDSSRVFVNKQLAVSEVRDYFPPEDDTTHVIRYSTACDDHFTVYDGYVRVPPALVTADDGVVCENDSADVPIRVQWIRSNSYTNVYVEAITKGPLLFQDVIGDTTDFNITWGEPHIALNGTYIDVTGSMAAGEVDTAGVLLKFLMSDREPSNKVTVVSLSKVRFYAFLQLDLYADLENGWVDTCGSRREDRNIIPTVPNWPQLAQNHPNPFNASTRIKFNLVNDGLATLEIYDILGRKVKKLLSEELESGSHLAAWDCTNVYGQRVSSGFYVYVLTADNITLSRKMLLLK